MSDETKLTVTKPCCRSWGFSPTNIVRNYSSGQLKQPSVNARVDGCGNAVMTGYFGSYTVKYATPNGAFLWKKCFKGRRISRTTSISGGGQPRQPHGDVKFGQQRECFQVTCQAPRLSFPLQRTIFAGMDLAAHGQPSRETGYCPPIGGPLRQSISTPIRE